MGCTTESGPDPDKSCVFPFKLGGNTHKCCTLELNDPGETNAWCSTMVDDLGEHVEGQGNWGICETKCQPKFTNGKLMLLKKFWSTLYKDLLLPSINREFVVDSVL